MKRKEREREKERKFILKEFHQDKKQNVKSIFWHQNNNYCTYLQRENKTKTISFKMYFEIFLVKVNGLFAECEKSKRKLPRMK